MTFHGNLTEDLLYFLDTVRSFVQKKQRKSSELCKYLFKKYK